MSNTNWWLHSKSGDNYRIEYKKNSLPGINVKMDGELSPGNSYHFRFLIMDPYQETRNTWNNLASAYKDKFMNLDLYNESYDHICTTIHTHNASILEIGCGPGNITRYLLSKRPDFKILGIDHAPNMIEVAKLNNPSADFAVMDCRQIRSLRQQFDGIIAGFCLPYLSPAEVSVLMADAHYLLNSNGLLYLSFVEGHSSQSGFKTGSGGRVYFHYHDTAYIISQLEQLRFSEINTYQVNYPISATAFEIHTIITAQKRNAENI